MRMVRRDVLAGGDERGAVMAIGNFDGFHRGHAAVLGEAAALAHAQGRPLGLITFEPHPRERLDPARAPRRLTFLRKKAQIARAAGIAVMVVLPFEDRLMTLSPEAFASSILKDRLGVSGLVAGSDFRFGHKRAGDMAMMAALGSRLGFAVRAVEKLGHEGAVISSTRIREALDLGDVRAAAAMLGRPFTLAGRVRHGDKRGRTIGFPTANLPFDGKRQMLPAKGVYAVTARFDQGPDGPAMPAVANLGTRPTFDGTTLLLEVHLLDASPDLYGARLEIGFIDKLRGEMKFSGIDALTAQIRKDCDAARAILGIAEA